MRLKTGQLKHLMDIQRPAGGRSNDYGEKVGETESVGSAWLSIETLTQNEAVKASTETRTATHRLRCYYDPTIWFDSSYRLVKDDRSFDVVSAINVDEENIEWEIIAGETNG